MEVIHHAEIIINIFLQSLGDWLTLVSQFFSFLGQGDIYILIAIALYWCINARWGLKLIVMLVLSVNLNSWLKLAFASPRPFWIDSRVKELAVETSFGLPSGHAMNSASMLGLAASILRKKWLRAALAATIFLIGLSRIALGVHFASDVLVGWLMGGLLLTVFIKWEEPINAWFNQKSYAIQLVLGLVSSLAILMVSFLLLRLRSGWTPPIDWLINAPDMNPLDPTGMITLAGIWLGVILSQVWWNHRYGALQPAKDLRTNALRFLIGLAGLFVLWYGWGLVFPDSLDAKGLALRYVRYTVVGAWIGGLAPVSFMKLKV